MDPTTPPLPVLKRTPDAALAVDQQPWSARPGADSLAPFPPPIPGREVVFTFSPADLSAAPPASALPNQVAGGKPFVIAFGALLLVLLAWQVGSTLRPSRPLRSAPPRPASTAFTTIVLPMAVPILVVGGFLLFASRKGKQETAQVVEGLGAQLVRLTPEYLYQLEAQNESKTRWTRVAGVVEGKDHLFLQYTTNAYLPIPKRAFASEDEVKAFREEATALWKAAGGGR